jgi:uncharacterized protein (DUF3084 family)
MLMKVGSKRRRTK